MASGAWERPTSFALALCIAGCGAGWHRPTDLAPQEIPSRQQVQIWQHGSVQQWHALQVTPDSMSGVPYFRPVNCDSCRRSVPREAVDSIRLGDPVAGFWKSVGLVTAVVVGLGVVYCSQGCSP